MLRHYLKANALLFVGSLLLTLFFAYTKAPRDDGAFFRGMVLALIYLGFAQIPFSILSIAYFLTKIKAWNSMQRIVIFALPHIIYALALVVKYTELLFIQSITNILVGAYTYRQFMKRRI